MADDFSARVTGLPDLRQALLSIPDKLRRRALRNALAAGARVVRDAARSRAPVLKSAAPYRTPGTLKKAIVVRTSKLARREGNVGVFVNVRPAKGSARGAKSRTDPFYWRWLEFGRSTRAGGGLTLKRRGRSGVALPRRQRAVGAIAPMRFLQQSAAKLDEALRIFIAKIGPQIQKLNGGKDVQL